jgi:hypothetical protein
MIKYELTKLNYQQLLRVINQKGDVITQMQKYVEDNYNGKYYHKAWGIIEFNTEKELTWFLLNI